MAQARLGRDRAARLRHARCDARDPGRYLRGSPGAPSRTGRRARLRPARRLRRPRAQRQPRLPDRLRPALRGGDPGRRTDGEPAILVGNECFGMAGAAPLPMRRHLFQDLSLPSQPRDRSRPLAEILADEGVAGRQPGSASSAGSHTPSRRRSKRRPSSSTSCAGSSGRAARSRTPPTCSSTRPTACGRSTRSTSWPPSSTPPARPRRASAACCRACARA